MILGFGTVLSNRTHTSCRGVFTSSSLLGSWVTGGIHSRGEQTAGSLWQMKADTCGAALTHCPLRSDVGTSKKADGTLIPRRSDRTGPPANLPIFLVVTRGRLGGGPSPSALAGYHRGVGEGTALSFHWLLPEPSQGAAALVAKGSPHPVPIPAK